MPEIFELLFKTILFLSVVLILIQKFPELHITIATNKKVT